MEHKDFTANSALMASATKVNNQALLAREYASENKTQLAIKSSTHALNIAREIFQVQPGVQHGFAQVAAGAVLMNIARCQTALTNVKDAANVSTLGLTIRLEAKEEVYNAFKKRIFDVDAKLVKECAVICSNSASEAETSKFNELRIDIPKLQQPARFQNIAMALLDRYRIIVKAIESQGIWKANPQSTEVLRAYAAEIKGLIKAYTLDLSVCELSQEQKQVFHPPEKAEPQSEIEPPHL